MSDPDERSAPADSADSADELRPRPQYGEYATPEEQRARIQQPDMTRLLETGQDPDALNGAAPAQAAAPYQGASAVTKPVGPPQKRGRFADRVATITLLAYGLVNVVTSVPTMIDYEAYVSTVLQILGIEGQLADPAAGRPWGIAAAVVLVIGWLLTAWISWRRLARGRLTWWIPLVAGVVFTAISGVLLMIPLVSDPALWNAVLESTR